MLAQAGLIAFCAPRGAWSLGKANFDELVDLVKDTGLPLILAGDNDEPGRLAMRKVRDLLKDRRIDSTDTAKYAPEKGSHSRPGPPKTTCVSSSLTRLLLQDRDEGMVRPLRSRKMYQEYWCPRRKLIQRTADDGTKVITFGPCGNTATCKPML